MWTGNGSWRPSYAECGLDRCGLAGFRLPAARQAGPADIGVQSNDGWQLNNSGPYVPSLSDVVVGAG